MLADKDYDLAATVARIKGRALWPVSYQSCWKIQRQHDRTLYSEHMARRFGRLKQFRRLATRYWQLQCCFHVTIAIACTWMYLERSVCTL